MAAVSSIVYLAALKVFISISLLPSSETSEKIAVAMNNTSITSRNFVQKNSTTHNASSRAIAEFDNAVNSSLKWRNESNCGVVTYTPLTPRNHYRIIGGFDSERGNWPWMAMVLRYYPKTGFSQTCGGTLIKPQWVLTAGHCFFGDPISYTHVVLGTYTKSETTSTSRTSQIWRFAVARYICHHSFIGPSNAYKDDICLIKLAGEAKYASYIKPICLPAANHPVIDNQHCRIAGWGVTATSSTGSDKLQTADVQIIEKAECSRWYKTEGITLPENHICAGYEKGGVDSCQGDSGGPLTCSPTSGTADKVVQYGITSFGIGCALAKRPGVYTNVAHYTSWIATKVHENSNSETCYNATDLLTCGSTITNTGTVLRSPIENTRTWIYPPNQRCSWKIKAPADCIIQLDFECFFHIEINNKDFSECYDYLEISSPGGESLIHCGSTLPNPITISSHEATLSFLSDSSIQSSGFVIRVVFLSSHSAPNNNSSQLHERAPDGLDKTPVGDANCDKADCRDVATKEVPLPFVFNLSYLLSFVIINVG